MNQESKFCITASGDDVSVEIEGGSKDLTNLLATVISESEEIEMVVTMVLLAVKMSSENKDKEDMLAKMMSSMRPKAQA